MLNLKNLKVQFALYLTVFAVYLAISQKDTGFFLTTVLAVSFSLLTDSIVLFLKKKIFRLSVSPLITGLIIGYVISSDEPWWKFALASFLAIISKYTIRLNGRHIFNPAAFGIFLTLILTGASTQWKGTYIWYIIIPLGAYFAFKAKKIEVIYGYFLVSFVLFGAQALLARFSFAEIFGFLSYFYIFVMIIEPRTSPVRPAGKYLFGASAALLIFVLTNLGVKFDAEIFSLLAANAFVPLFNKL